MDHSLGYHRAQKAKQAAKQFFVKFLYVVTLALNSAFLEGVQTSAMFLSSLFYNGYVCTAVCICIYDIDIQKRTRFDRLG